MLLRSYRCIAQKGIRAMRTNDTKPFSNRSFSYPYPDDDIADLRRALRDNAALVAQTLLGPWNRKHSTRQQLRFGRDKGSLSVEIGRKNPGTWYDWGTDDHGDMFDLIEHVKGCDFNEAKKIAHEITGTPATATSKYSSRSRLIYPDDKPDPGTTKYAGMIWTQSVDPRGTRVEEYLRSRDLNIPDGVAIDVLRYHRPFNCAGYKTAAMVALFRDIKTDEPCGVSVTFLDRNAGKIARRFYGKVGSGAIKFAGATDILNIGEGIESTLSGLAMGYAPAWCVGSSGSIARFPVVAGVTTLRVFGERGDGGANAKAVKKLTAGWSHSGADIFVVEPKIGNDLNDAWRGEVTS
jgi:hypothetical protein